MGTAACRFLESALYHFVIEILLKILVSEIKVLMIHSRLKFAHVMTAPLIGLLFVKYEQHDFS